MSGPVGGLPSWKPRLERAYDVFRREPCLAAALFLGLWIPQAFGWLLARSVAHGGFHAAQAAGATVFVSLPILILAPAFASGTMALFGEAVQGRPAIWRAFREGMGRHYWKVVGGFLLFMLVSLLVTIPLGLATGAGADSLATTAGAATAQPSLLAILSVAERPLLAVFALAGLVMQFAVVYWSPAVQLGNRGVFAAVSASVRFAGRTWLPTAVAVVANAVVMSVVLGVVRQSAPPPLPPVAAGPEAILAAARTATVASLAWTTAATLVQAVWQAFYRSWLWTLFREAGGSDGADAPGTAA